MLEFLRATAEDLEDYMKAKIDDFQRVSESRNRSKSNFIFRKRVSGCKVLEIVYAVQKL